MTDVGGNLLKILNDGGYQWYPLLRSNTTNLHPLWFGIYADIVYHHGAGFRDPECRIDRIKHGFARKGWRRLLIPPIIPHYIRMIKEKFGLHSLTFQDTQEYKYSKELMNRIYSEIEENEEFYAQFMELKPSDLPG